MSFHVGQKVVCVRDGWNIVPDGFHPSSPLPRAGVEYIVRTVEPSELVAGASLIRLHWLILPKLPNGWEPNFSTVGYDGKINFRPITERKTDIEIFRRLLVPGTKIEKTV